MVHLSAKSPTVAYQSVHETRARPWLAGKRTARLVFALIGAFLTASTAYAGQTTATLMVTARVIGMPTDRVDQQTLVMTYASEAYKDKAQSVAVCPGQTAMIGKQLDYLEGLANELDQRTLTQDRMKLVIRQMRVWRLNIVTVCPQVADAQHAQ